MKKHVILSLYPSFRDLSGCTLSDMCLVWFRKPPSTLFAVYRTGFLTCSCAVKDAVFESGLTGSLCFFNQMKIKKNKVHAALDLMKVSDSRTEGMLDSQLFHWVSLWLWASCIISFCVGLLACKMQFIHIHVAHNDAIRLNWCLQSSSWPLWETCYRNSKL